MAEFVVAHPWLERSEGWGQPALCKRARLPADVEFGGQKGRGVLQGAP